MASRNASETLCINMMNENKTDIMKKKLTLLALLAALLLPVGAAAQDTLDVANGTATNSYVPVWGLWLDNTTHTQSIYPESVLSELEGGTITSLTWSVSSAPSAAWTSIFTIRLASTEDSLFLSTFADISQATEVYTGTLTVSGNVMSVELDDPFVYEGGNLLVDFQSVVGNWSSVTFMGSSAFGVSSIYSRGDNSPSTTSFLPALKIVYTAGGSSICRKPYNLQVSNITTDGADFTWNTRNGESSWQVYVDGEFVTTVSDSSYTATGLSAATAHTFGVAAACTDGATSGIATLGFRTACDMVSLPWSDSFESYTSGTGNRPDCWGALSTYNSYPYIYSTDGSNTYFMYSYGTPNFVSTPIFGTPVNQLHVVFRANVSSYGSGVFEAGVMTDTADQNTFVPVLTINGNGATWNEYEFFTDTVGLNDNGCVAFRWTNTNGYSAYLDDVVVEVASDCRRPATASVSQPTYEGATVSWTDNGTAATGYTVRVARVNNVDDTSAADMPFGASPAVLTSLESYTTYYAWVATNCGSEQTMWRAAGSFTTQRDCYPVQNLTVADMNQTSAALTWTYQDGMGREATGVSIRIVDQTMADTTYLTATGTAAFLTGLDGGHSYSVSVTTQCDGDYEAYSAAATTFETPSCGQVAGTTTTSYSPFYGYYKYGYSQTVYPASIMQGMSEITGIKYRAASAPSSVYNRVVKVYMANTGQTLLDTNNYVALDDLTLVYDGSVNVSTTGWKTITFSSPFTWDGESNVVVAVQNLTGEYSSFTWGAHVADEGNTVYWYRDSDTVTAANPNAPYNNSLPSRGKSATVPDITFLGECETPACLAPITVFGSSTANSVTIEWIAGSEESSWTVEYRLDGDTVWQTAVASTSQTTYTVGGLDASTLYEFRVGSLCSGHTLYSPAFIGRTACGDISLPFTETFEGWTGSNPFPTCWYKVQSNGNYPYIYNTTATSSYVVSGTATMYLYGSSSATAMMASPEVPADADNIKVTFWSNGWSTTNVNMQAGVLIDPADPASFVACTVVATGATAANSSATREYEFYTDDITATGNVHIAFRVATATAVYIDDVTIAEAGTCRKPNTPSRNNIGYYTATLHWNDVNHGTTAYDVRYGTVNDVDAYSVQVTASGDSIDLSGLHNGTTYYAWVRQQCSTSDDDWLAIPSFTTLVSCYPVINISLGGHTLTTAALNWSYSSNGMIPDGVLVSLMDMTDSTMAIEDEEMSGTSHIFTYLNPGHVYRAYFMTLCDPDTSAAVTFNFSTDAPSCAEVTGTSASNSYVPFNRYYNYGYTQTLYTASELAGLDSISGIGFATNDSYDRTKVYTLDVYLSLTSQTTLTTTTAIPYSQMTLVASGVHWTPGRDFTSITFDTPFAYDGTSNLVVIVDNNTGSYDGSGLYWRSHSYSGGSLRVYSDGTNYNPSTVSGSSMTAESFRPDIRFYGNCTLEDICSAPIMIVDSATTTSVGLQWAADNASTYTVEHRETGADTWTTDASNLTSTTYTVNGLQPSTSYDFRVGGSCGDSVRYSAVKTTYTECDAMAVPVTFTFSTELSPCWTLTNSNVSRNSTNNALFWNYSSYSIGAAVLPELDEPVNNLMAVIRARYSYSSGGTHTMLVGVGNAAGMGITWIDTVDLTTTYADYIVYFSDYAGTGDRIVISKDGGNYLYVERIDVGIDNGCHPVNGFACTGTTSNSATFGWNANSAANLELQYRLVGADTWQSQAATGTAATINGLQPSSSYEARIRAICSTTDSSIWSSTVSFTTACGAVDMPWSENFDAVSSMTALNCWNRYTGLYDDATGTATLSTSTSWSTSTTAVLDGSHVKLNIYGTSCRHWLVTPEISISEGANLTFDVALTAYYSANAPSLSDVADDRFMVLVTTDGGATWSPVATWGSADSNDYAYTSLGTTGLNVDLSLNAFVGQAIRIGFYGESTVSGGDNDLHIDNISVAPNGETPVTPCVAPTNVAVSNVGTTTATIGWTENNGATLWHFELVSGGTTVLNGGMASNPYTISGLTEGTTYSVRVRSICDTYNYSDWSDYVGFTTDTTGSNGIEHAGLDDVSLAPNPAASIVTVSGLVAGAQLTVVDLNGRAVASCTADAGSLSLDVSRLAKGTYFVRIVSDNGTAVRKLIVR